MPVNFRNLNIGTGYTRKTLAALWGYKDFHAIGRGVITPTNTNIIVLFVTEEKQASIEQYKDRMVGNMLYWEGETKHGSDQRVIGAAENGDEVHLFYRAVHHTPFIYFGRLSLLEYRECSNTPSSFVFRVGPN